MRFTIVTPKNSVGASVAKIPSCKPKIVPAILLNEAPEGSGLNSNDIEPRSRPETDSQSTEKSAAINNLGSKLTVLPPSCCVSTSLFKATLAA